jgi:hypothetical protein
MVKSYQSTYEKDYGEIMKAFIVQENPQLSPTDMCLIGAARFVDEKFYAVPLEKRDTLLALTLGKNIDVSEGEVYDDTFDPIYEE